jgi:DNA polymerase-1
MGHPNGAYVESQFPLRESAQKRIEKGLPLRPQDYSTDVKKEVKIFTEPPKQLTRTFVFSAMADLFKDDTITKVGHNLAFDLGSVAKYLGEVPAGPYADTMIAAFLVDSSKSFGYGLKDVSKLYAGITMQKGVGAEIEKYSFDEVARYAELDAYATISVWKVLSNLIVKDNLSKVFALEMDVLRVVTEMRLSGATIDTASLTNLKARLESDIESARGRVYRIAGEEFNINSTVSKQRLLYGKKGDGGRGLKPTMLTPGGKEKKRTKTPLALADYSVSAEALDVFRTADPLVDALLDFSDLNKLLSTYVLPYMGGVVTRVINGKMNRSMKAPLLDKGRLHTDFNQIGAATGRFSSRNPNLQNVPAAGSDYGKLIRNLFVAPEGHQLVVADYSQIEPRIIASFSKDPVMLDTYHQGGDIYTAIGETMGVNRKAGKVLVLSIAYGVGAEKISRQIDCSVKDAEELLKEFTQKFKNITRLKSLTIRTARKKVPVPYVGTLTGRRRYLPDLVSPVWWQAAKAERQAFNTLIQGSAADVMKIAMVRAFQQIPESASLILTVHDELVTVTPRDLAEETAECIRTAMEGVHVLQVPLVADVEIVDKWGEAK